MARLFDNASSEYLEYAGAPVTGPPFTMSCWAYSVEDGLSNQHPFALGRAATPYEGYQISFQTTLPNDPIRFLAYGGAAENFAIDINSVWTINTWYHLCFVVAARDNRAAYVNYSNSNTDANTETIDTLTQMRVGARGWAGALHYLSGGAAEPAIWNVALTDAEVAILAKGYSPLFVRPESLVFYAPLIQDEDRDIVGGIALTDYNTPTVAAHPRIIYPGQVQIGITGVSGPVHETASVDLARIVALLESGIASGNAVGNLGRAVGVAEMALSATISSILISRGLDIDVVSVAALVRVLGLSRESGLSTEAIASVVASYILSRQSTAATIGLATAGSALPLARTDDVEEIGQASASADHSLSRVLGVAEGAGGAAQGSLLAQRVLGDAESGSAAGLANVTLAGVRDIAIFTGQVVSELLSLAYAVATSQSAAADSVASRLEQLDLSVSSHGQSVSISSVSLESALALLATTGQAVLEALELARFDGLSDSASSGAASPMSLVKGIGESFQSAASGFAALHLSRAEEALLYTGQIVNKILELAKSGNLVASASGIANAAVDLDQFAELLQSVAAAREGSIDLDRVDTLLAQYYELVGVVMRKCFGIKVGSRQPFDIV